MLHHWLKPTKKNTQLIDNQIGSRILIHNEVIPDLSKVKSALIGLDDSADIVRDFLYSYTAFGDENIIADLGNIRKSTPDFIIPLINELLQIGILPILVGSNSDLIAGQFQAYQTLKSRINITIVDEAIRLSLSGSQRQYINMILEEEKDKRLHLSVIGAQGHLTDHDVLTYFEMKLFDTVRLGQIKAQPEEVEPLIRDADMMIFNVSSLKQSEAPAQKPFSPSGLFIEEACRLVRYAGMSDKLSSIGFYGFDLNADINHQTAQGLAQMIWYFWDGFLNRKNDFPTSTDGLVEYIVDYKSNNNGALTFWRSTKSGRWWLQTTFAKDQKSNLVPCSYKDYQLACEGELPERLLNAIQRLT
jgi:formiminoglutamase